MKTRFLPQTLGMLALTAAMWGLLHNSASAQNGKPLVGPKDWNQWGGGPHRNNVSESKNIPTTWNVKKGTNIKWVAQLGSQTYGNPIIANGKVYVGTNNGAGHLARYPAEEDLGVLLCFDEATGKFLWQHSSEKLSTGRVHDWPLQGICAAALAEGDRVWFVSSRGEVRCLDTEGYYDNEDDSPIQNEWARLFNINKLDDASKDQMVPAVTALNQGQLNKTMLESLTAAGMPIEGSATFVEGNKWSFTAKSNGAERKFKAQMEGPKLAVYKLISTEDKEEADVVWVLDMMKELNISQHNMCNCSLTVMGDMLFVNTSNGVDEGHLNLPQPAAASFIVVNKHTGEVQWTDNSPGANVLHGQWSSPAYAEIGGVPQVIFGGGDGWLYAFDSRGDNGKAKLLWKFDCNPKESKYLLGGRATRNHLIGTPVVYKDRVYIGVGEDPEHGEGEGHLWCVDATKRGDVSPTLVFNKADGFKEPIPHKRLQSCEPDKGDVERPNPNSAVVWHYDSYDKNKNGKIEFEETMHRTCGTVVIKDDILYIADFSGLFHCIDANTGIPHWTYDMLAACWGSALLVDGHVFIGDEDGEMSIFKHSKDPEDAEPLAEINMTNAIYTSAVAANDTLFVTNRTHLFAIQKGAQLADPENALKSKASAGIDD